MTKEEITLHLANAFDAQSKMSALYQALVFILLTPEPNHKITEILKEMEKPINYINDEVTSLAEKLTMILTDYASVPQSSNRAN